jgi:hypothetical protein
MWITTDDSRIFLERVLMRQKGPDFARRAVARTAGSHQEAMHDQDARIVGYKLQADESAVC